MSSSCAHIFPSYWPSWHVRSKFNSFLYSTVYRHFVKNPLFEFKWTLKMDDHTKISNHFFSITILSLWYSDRKRRFRLVIIVFGPTK